MKTTKEQLILKLSHKKLNILMLQRYIKYLASYLLMIWAFINGEELEVINLYEDVFNKVLKKVGNNARNIGTRKI